MDGRGDRGADPGPGRAAHRRRAHRPDTVPAGGGCRGEAKSQAEGSQGRTGNVRGTLASRTVPRMRAAEEAGPSGPAPAGAAPAGAVSCGGAGNPARSV